MTKQTTDNI